MRTRVQKLGFMTLAVVVAVIATVSTTGIAPAATAEPPEGNSIPLPLAGPADRLPDGTGGGLDPRVIDLRNDQVPVPGLAHRRVGPPSAGRAAARVHHIWVSVINATPENSDNDVKNVNSTDVRQLISRMNSYWSAESGGAVHISLSGIETVELGQVDCDASDAWSRVGQSAFRSRFASGRWVGSNDHLLMLTRESCGTLGFGTVGGDGGLILSAAGAGPDLGVPVALHEFGHNLGLSHANAAICRTAAPYDAPTADFARESDDPTAPCLIQEYADFLDIMGYSISATTPHLSAPQRILAGYTSAYATVTRDRLHSEFQLRPLASSSGTRALRIVDPTTRDSYYVEVRSAAGVDANSAEFTWNDSCTEVSTGFRRCELDSDAATGAVRILRAFPLAGEAAQATTVLAVGPVPGGDVNSRHTHLIAGDSFTNYNRRFTVTVNSLDPTAGASLSVDFVPQQPTHSTLTLDSLTQTYGSATRATLRAAVARVEGSFPNGSFEFRSQGHRLATVAAAQGTARLWMPRTLSAGSHTVTARFIPTDDVAGSTSAPVTLAVARASSAVTTRGPTSVRIGRTTRLRVSVTVPEVSSPTGTVAAYAAGYKLGTARLSSAKHGVVSLPLRPFTHSGTKRITVRYGGTSNVVGSTATPRTILARR